MLLDEILLLIHINLFPGYGLHQFCDDVDPIKQSVGPLSREVNTAGILVDLTEVSFLRRIKMIGVNPRNLANLFVIKIISN